MQKNLIFGNCLPTAFCSSMEHVATVTTGQDRFIVRTLHLRDSLFLRAYANNVIDIVDVSNLSEFKTIDKMIVGENEAYVVDLDFYRDETCIAMGCRGDIGLIVNMRTKTVTRFDHRMPHPISLIQFAKHLPDGAEPVFFMLSKGGVYRVMNMQLQYQEIAKFHPS